MAAPRFLPAGDAALLLELDTLDAILALFQRAGRQRPAGVTDLVPAARTLLVCFEPEIIAAAGVVSWLRACLRQLAGAGGPAAPRPGAGPHGVAAQATDGRRVEIPVRYAGEDLDEVAERLGLSRAEVIERHAGIDFRAAFAGFAPGFVYLTGGDPCFQGLPRRPSPRTRVPAGSVAAAGEFSAVYPSDSPGGWQLLGVTPARMWDLGRREPALVQPGFRVRFVDLDRPRRVLSLGAGEPAASAGEAGAGALGSPSPRAVPPAAARLEILEVGAQTLFQDLGRPGLTGMGVSRSGALDRAALRRANRLVGNPSGSAVLENALGGLRLVCRGQAVVAVTGALAPVTVTTGSGMRLPAAAGRALSLEDGQILRVGPARAGVRCYVAVRGGFAVEPVLGSCATDVLAGIGPPPVRAGDVYAVGAGPVHGPGAPDAEDGMAATDARGPAPQDADGPADLPRPGELVWLDIVVGPREDWFDRRALDLLCTQEWRVTPQSNRVGMRLSGAEPLARRRNQELPSEGTVAGAIQVPASGQPVLFLADHPLTGGYPVIAVVHSRDQDRLAQIPVGARLRFRVTAPA